MILSRRLSPLRISILGLVVSVTYFYPLTQTTLAATLRLFRDPFIDEPSSSGISTSEKLIDPDLLTQLISPETILGNSEDGFSSNGIEEAVSGRSSLSFESIVSSLTQIELDRTLDDTSIPEVPILPQVAAPDIYKGIYDFGTTAAEDLSDPVRVGVLPVLDLELIPTPTFRGGVGISNNPLPGVGTPGLNQSEPPRFGGPIPIISGPSVQFSAPLSQVPLPSAKQVQAGSWGDEQVDVFFASLPKTNVVDISTFMRTIYRTSPSDMIKRIDASLDLTVDANFNTMPSEIFPSNSMPSGEFNRSL
ncbi:MAG: hypothetical protein QNJ64_10895 [Crocosphaera sp.]|nr:hypothetical protein [Crocosphaera sp.]